MEYEPHRCQTCGAFIGYLGIFFQRFLGCRLVVSRECKKFRPRSSAG